MGRFFKQEFCLVIGLRFRQLSTIFNEEYHPLDGKVHDRYFDNGDVKANQLLERFVQIDFQKKGDTVKMIFELFVENILCSRDYRKKVSHWLWAMMEDVEEFNKFA